MLPKYVEEFCVAVVPVGSRVVCKPPPMDTDIDFLCLLEEYDDLSVLADKLDLDGWDVGGSGDSMSGFESWKKEINGEIYNLILTADEPFFNDFMKATMLCQLENALDKKRRIAIFDEVFGKKKKKSKLHSLNLSQASLEGVIHSYNTNNWTTFQGVTLYDDILPTTGTGLNPYYDNN